MLSVFLLAFCGVFLSAPSAFAGKNLDLTHLLPSEEDKAVQGFKAIKRNNWEKGRRLIGEAKDPVAAKMYYWYLFHKDKGEDHFLNLVHFIRKNPEWPGIRHLRLIAEDSIPKGFPADHIMAWFKDYPPITAKGLSRHIIALKSRGYLQIAQEDLNKFWARSRTSRDDQRYLYKVHKNMLTREAHKERLNMLLYAEDYTNARAIAAVLGSDYKRLAEARISLSKNQSNVNRLINKVPKSLQDDIGLKYERLRWRRRHDLNDRAAQLLIELPAGIRLENASEWWRERHILIRRYLEEKNYVKAYALATTHRQISGFSFVQAEWVAGWIALRFMHKPEDALHRFKTLHQKVHTPISRARAAYWAGRSLQSIGDEAQAQDWFKKAAQYQTAFYGQLAAYALSEERDLPHMPPPRLGEAQIQTYAEDELIRAAMMFQKAGMRDEASRFLRTFMYYNETPEAYVFLSELSADMDMYHDSIHVAKKANSKGLFMTAQAYPTITKQLEDIDLEWALIHALIRQESAFDFDARSPAGARGLMQIMPATAKEVARKASIKHKTAWLTQRPAHNIFLGSRYLYQLLTRFQGSYPLAIAAYNAGPNRVDRWLKTYGDPRFGEVSLLDWIELIPIYETRNYVQRVMEGTYVYRLRLDGVQKPPKQSLHVACFRC